MNIYVNEYIIGEVLDLSTGERSKKFGYRVGRKCIINDKEVNLNRPLVVYYENGSWFDTTPLNDINEDEYGFWATTKNRAYRFDNKYYKE